MENRLRSAYRALCVGSALCALSACDADTSPPEAPPGVGVELAALENPILECQAGQAACVGTASSFADLQTCGTGFTQCLQAAATTAEQTAERIASCREQAAQCLTSGGAQGVSTCRSEYEACVAAGADGGVADVAADAGQPTSGGLGSFFPPLGGGLTLPGFGGLPQLGGGSPQTGGSSDGGVASGGPSCLATLRTCVSGGGDPVQCADDARECLRASLFGP